MNFTLQQLRYLIAVAEHANVTAAASALHTSQPGVSTAISHLEEAFGVQLFVRHHARGVSLTPAGRTFVAAARNLLLHADDLGQKANELNESIRGDLDLGCFQTIGLVLLPRLLRRFRNQYPGVHVNLHEGDTEQLQHKLRNAVIELALLYDLDLDRAFTKVTLFSLRPYALLPTNHRLAKHSKVYLKELASEPMVLLDLPRSKEYFLSLFAQAGAQPCIRHRTVSFELVRGLVAAGEGYALLNLRPKFDLSYDGSPLVGLRIADDLPSLPVVIAWHKSLKPTRRASAFTGVCLAAVKEETRLSVH